MPITPAGVMAGVSAYQALQSPYEPSPISLGRIEEGHKLDNQYRSLAETTAWEKGQERGLTPQEYYGSGASGAPNVSGGAQVLGNNQTALDSQKIQASTQMRNAAADRAVKLAQTKIQSDTQIKSAQIASGATIRGQDINESTQIRGQDLKDAVANKNYKLAKQKLETIETPKLLQELEISKQQFKLLTNQIATSTKKFTLYMAKLKMGVDNMMVEFLQHSYGINITDPKSIQDMSESQRAKFLQNVAGINSFAFKEAAGIRLGAESTSSDIGQGVTDILGNTSISNYPTSTYKHGSVHDTKATIGKNSPGQGGYGRQPNIHRDNRYN